MFILNYKFPLDIFAFICLCTLIYYISVFVTDYSGPDSFLRNEEMETEETFFGRFVSPLGTRRASLNMGWMCWSGNPSADGIILGAVLMVQYSLLQLPLRFAEAQIAAIWAGRSVSRETSMHPHLLKTKRVSHLQTRPPPAAMGPTESNLTRRLPLGCPPASGHRHRSVQEPGGGR